MKMKMSNRMEGGSDVDDKGAAAGAAGQADCAYSAGANNFVFHSLRSHSKWISAKAEQPEH
eukprot:764809-Hanusia_phi.AAC.2